MTSADHTINTELIKNKEHKVLDFLFYWGRPIRVGDLVKELKIKHSTLNSVLHRLVEEGTIQWETYRLVSLTEQGKEKAAHLSNHHFILEKYLKSTLDLSDIEVHEEALQLAGAISCRLIEAICRKLKISHELIGENRCSQREYFDLKNPEKNPNKKTNNKSLT